jgi:hypothetical protein
VRTGRIGSTPASRTGDPLHLPVRGPHRADLKAADDDHLEGGWVDAVQLSKTVCRALA